GYYLQKTGFLTYDSILTYESFNSNDANMTYAVAGLYNSFLLRELGINQYIELYKKVNGDFEFVKNITVSDFKLPNKSKFEEYLKIYKDNMVMYVDEKDTLKPILRIKDLNGIYAKSGNYIKFFTTGKYEIGFGD